MTIAMLLINTLTAARRSISGNKATLPSLQPILGWVEAHPRLRRAGKVMPVLILAGGVGVMGEEKPGPEEVI